MQHICLNNRVYGREDVTVDQMVVKNVYILKCSVCNKTIAIPHVSSGRINIDTLEFESRTIELFTDSEDIAIFVNWKLGINSVSFGYAVGLGLPRCKKLIKLPKKQTQDFEVILPKVTWEAIENKAELKKSSVPVVIQNCIEYAWRHFL